MTVDTIYHNTNEFLNLVGRIVSIVDYNNDGSNDIAWLISEGTVAGIPNLGGGTFAGEWETILPVYEARSETNTLQSGVYFVTIQSDTSRAFSYRKLVKL